MRRSSPGTRPRRHALVGVALLGLGMGACAGRSITSPGPAWTHVEQCAADRAGCTSGCAAGDGNKCSLTAVLYVEESRPTLDTAPLNRLESLMADTHAACLVSKEERACRANRVASGVYAGRPGHDPALAGGAAPEAPAVGVITLDEVMKRAKVVREMADEAVRLDGSPEASLVKRLFQACPRNHGQRFCTDFATFATDSDINLVDHPDLMPNLGLRQGGHPSRWGSSRASQHG